MIYNFDSLTFQLLSVNRFSHKEGFFKVKARPYAALSLRISGSGAFFSDGKAFTNNPGDVLFIPEGLDYDVTYSGGESIVAHLTDCNYFVPESITCQNRSEIYKNFLSLSDNWRPPYKVNGGKALIYEILQHLSDGEAETEEDAEFAKCLDFIAKNIENPELSVNDVCRQAGISSSSLYRKFMLKKSLSPQKYIMSLRLSLAVGMLVKPDASVSETAAKCGFADEKYFSRTIKKHYGVPPSHLKSERL